MKPENNLNPDNRSADDESASIGVMMDAGAQPEEAARFKRRVIKQAAMLLGGLLVLGVLTSLPPVRHFITDNQPRLKQFIHDCGPWAPVVFTASVAVLVGCGLPRLAFHFLGGALFAFWGGLLWSCLGTMIGYGVVFFAVRQLGWRETILRKHPAWEKLAAKLKHNTVPAVILFRQIPLPGMVTNVVLGLSPIRRREFFLGTGIGLFPEAVPLVLIGSGLRKEELGHTMIYLVGAVGLFIITWIAWGAYTRHAAAKAAAGVASTTDSASR
ncbi:MAG: VTT domain-containing protein [Verrucomicrobiota bacterium]